jgi:hypothetical protein
MKESIHLENLNTGLQAESQVLQYNARIRATREGKINRRTYAYRMIAIEHDIGSLAKGAANPHFSPIR